MIVTKKKQEKNKPTPAPFNHGKELDKRYKIPKLLNIVSPLEQMENREMYLIK